MSLPFVKVEGLGNDFLLIDLREPGGRSGASLEAEIAELRERAPVLCDRRRGVGGDGLLVVTPSGSARAAMIVINFDGSRPEMCGNGLRCVAAHIGASAGLSAGASFVVETDAGLLCCDLEALAAPAGGFEAEIRIDMGPAQRLGRAIPEAGEGREFINLSMGNPHAVCLVGPDESPESLARRLGPGIELDPAYRPAKTNVEFVRVESPDRLELWVWERGVGITEACGTGACATAVAAVDAGCCPAAVPLEVRLPGGPLTITVPSDPGDGVLMAGPAREVFRGKI